jgi:DNA-binding transcriptional ArsR family regulator
LQIGIVVQLCGCIWGEDALLNQHDVAGGGMKLVELEAVLEALADPTRRTLLAVLVAKGDASATAASKLLPVTRQALVKHLGVLKQAGLVGSRRSGREVRYVVRPDRLEAAARGLGLMAAEWEMRLAMHRRMSERSLVTGPFGQPRLR